MGISKPQIIVIGVFVVLILSISLIYFLGQKKAENQCQVGGTCVIEGKLGYYDKDCKCVEEPECSTDVYVCKWNDVATWGNCVSNFGCSIACSVSSSWAQQWGCSCESPVPQPAQEGESCLTKNCDVGLECSWDPNPLKGFRVCKYPNEFPPEYADIGGYCGPLGKECKVGLVCTTLQTCQLPAGLGESCLSKECAYPYVCKWDANPLKGFKVCKSE